MNENYPWEALKALRTAYLSEKPVLGDYWTSDALLELYDLSLGTRIGWKWQAVCRELSSRGLSLLPGQKALDWGCGTGVASQVFFEALGSPATLHVFDRSERAQIFAQRRLHLLLKDVPVQKGLPNEMSDLLLLSHVLTEVDEATLSNIKKRIRLSKSFVWVEPGTSKIGRMLPALRDELVRSDWEVLGPCPHQAQKCGLLLKGRENDWCHNFAETPASAHQDPFWSLARRELGIDLRRTPYTYLAMQKKGAGVWKSAALENPIVKVGEAVQQTSRILGEARHYKGYAKLLLCRRSPEPDGQGEVDEFTLQKRDSPDLLKQLKKDLESPFIELEFGTQKKVKEIVSKLEAPGDT